MLTVDHYEIIRRKHLVEGLSQRAVARELKHSRKTVAKAIQHARPPGYQLGSLRPRPMIDPVRGIIDAWLEQDKSAPRKQRHTAQRIYERLREEHGFAGHPGTVRRYVRKALRRQQEVFMPLAFEPGEEAQVDWKEGGILQNGQPRKVQLFCLRLCYSKASFVVAYERATLESFLDGHVRAFELLGGVPRRLAYDNLKSAVIQVGHGQERRLNDRFRELRSWYLFESRFCNVGRGNEKGDVENLAKRSGQSYLVPVPEVTTLEELREKLLADCRRDLELPAPPPNGQRRRRELLEEERARLLELPADRFPACRELSTFVDKRSLVHLETNRYSLPVQWAYQPCVIRAYVDRVELWCEHHCVATHLRCYEREQYRLEPEHYLPLLERKPGSLDNARPFKGQPWGEEFELMRSELEYRYESDGTRRYIDLLLLMTRYPEPAVKEAVSLCVKRRAFSDEAVLSVLRNEPVRSFGRLDLSDRPEWVQQGDGIRPTQIYDRLRVEEVAL